MSPFEELLKALVEDGATDIVPKSRLEACLKNCLEGLGTEGLPAPISRAEAYLHILADAMMGGYGGEENYLSNLTNFFKFYYGGHRLSDVPPESLNLRKGTNFESMFDSCPELESIGDLKFGDGSYKNLFYNNKKLKSVGNLSFGTGSAYYMFYQCNELESIGSIRGLKATSCYAMFDQCHKLKLPDVLEIDTSECTNFEYMFSYCHVTTNLPKMNTSKGTNFADMFRRCYAVKTFPELDTSNGTNFRGMFEDARLLDEIPEWLNTSNATNVNSMFEGTSIKTVCNLDLRNVTTANELFYRCTALESIYDLDFRSCTNFSSAFYAGYNTRDNLTNVYIRNIKTSLSLSTTSGKITPDSLIHTIKELRDTGASKTLTIGTTHLAKIANTYVKLIPITDEMRAEDDLIDEKLPFEVCESTDEGAILITDYVGEKNWVLK